MPFLNLFFIFNIFLIATCSAVSIESHHTSSHRHISTFKPSIRSATHSLPTRVFPQPTSPSTSIPPIQTRTPHSPSFQPSGQKPIFVVFEVLGGLLASGLILGLVRCCYQYKKAPTRDRIAEVLNRHNLQREMEELERNPQILRRASLREPAPPYCPAPPSYEIITSSPNDTDVGTRNSSSSPAPQPSSLIPPRPAG